MSVTIEGIGLHSGQPVKALLSPAPAGSGLTFLHHGKRLAATIKNLKNTERGTSLLGIAVVEHFLSAAYGLGIYDLELTVEGDELPALDGSALPWVEAIEKLELVKRRADGFVLFSPILITDGDASLEALPYDGFKVDFMVNFAGIGEQRFVFDAEKMAYRSEIAPARTFGYLAEYEELKQRQLALGASFDNSLVLGPGGYINQPRFADELVRHKVLDLIGDLALLGRPLLAEIKAVRSGHKLNAELVRRVLNQ